jgi:hypothetical protein
LAATEAETLALTDIKSAGEGFEGRIQRSSIEDEEAPKERLFQQYGTRTFTTFKKHPELVSFLKRLYPKFDPHTMATSDLNGIATIGDRTIFILAGCFPHNCGGTTQVVAFEPATRGVYLLRPTNVGADTEPSGKFQLYGNPDKVVRAAMCSVYPD